MIMPAIFTKSYIIKFDCLSPVAFTIFAACNKCNCCLKGMPGDSLVSNVMVARIVLFRNNDFNKFDISGLLCKGPFIVFNLL